MFYPSKINGAIELKSVLAYKQASGDFHAAAETYDQFLATLSVTGVPSRAGMETLVKAIQSQGRHVDRKVGFSDIADDRLATEVAKELGYKTP